MGDPAAMTPADRAFTVNVARLIVEGVENDTNAPTMELQWCAHEAGIPLDTLILWLAQVVMEKP